MKHLHVSTLTASSTYSLAPEAVMWAGNWPFGCSMIYCVWNDRHASVAVTLSHVSTVHHAVGVI